MRSPFPSLVQPLPSPALLSVSPAPLSISLALPSPALLSLGLPLPPPSSLGLPPPVRALALPSFSAPLAAPVPHAPPALPALPTLPDLPAPLLSRALLSSAPPVFSLPRALPACAAETPESRLAKSAAHLPPPGTRPCPQRPLAGLFRDGAQFADAGSAAVLLTELAALDETLARAVTLQRQLSGSGAFPSTTLEAAQTFARRARAIVPTALSLAPPSVPRRPFYGTSSFAKSAHVLLPAARPRPPQPCVHAPSRRLRRLARSPTRRRPHAPPRVRRCFILSFPTPKVPSEVRECFLRAL